MLNKKNHFQYVDYKGQRCKKEYIIKIEYLNSIKAKEFGDFVSTYKIGTCPNDILVGDIEKQTGVNGVAFVCFLPVFIFFNFG